MMRVHVLVREQTLHASPSEAFGFFADAFNLEAITPSWLRFRVVTPAPITMGAGTFIRYRLRLHGVPVRWDTVIEAWEPPSCFVDVQVRGPYALWHHTHELSALEGGRTLMRDTVRYALGFGMFGSVAHRAIVRRDLRTIFDYRAARVAELVRASSAR